MYAQRAEKRTYQQTRADHGVGGSKILPLWAVTAAISLCFLGIVEIMVLVNMVTVGQAWLTTGQAAMLLGTSRQHVVDLCRRGMVPFETVGSHRRLRRADVEAFAGGTLTRDQARGLWLHRAVAGRLALDPDGTLNKARANLEKLQRVHPTGMAARWLGQWQAALDAGTEAVFDVLVSRSPQAVELRQNSPFADVLSEQERQAALAAFRSWWHRERTA